MNLLQAALNVGMTILPRLDTEPSLCFTALTLQEFANVIIAATKEEDAKICEEFGKPNSMQSISESIHTETASKQIAAAIRESKP